MAETNDEQHKRAVKVAKAVTAAAASSGQYPVSELADLVNKIYQVVRELDGKP